MAETLGRRTKLSRVGAVTTTRCRIRDLHKLTPTSPWSRRASTPKRPSESGDLGLGLCKEPRYGCFKLPGACSGGLGSRSPLRGFLKAQGPQPSTSQRQAALAQAVPPMDLRMPPVALANILQGSSLATHVHQNDEHCKEVRLLYFAQHLSSRPFFRSGLCGLRPGKV